MLEDEEYNKPIVQVWDYFLFFFNIYVCYNIILFIDIFILVNLSTVGQEDSSSEEAGNGTNTGNIVNNKPVVPPRPPRSVVDSSQHRRNMGMCYYNNFILKRFSA